MFYVYCYFNPLKVSDLHECGFEPFYVGKGKAERMNVHLLPSSLKNERNRHKAHTINQILAAGLQPIIITLLENLTEQDALISEIEFIAKWGRADKKLGPLTNLTDGGDGTTGKVFTEEYRKKLSEGTKRAFAEGKLSSNLEAFKYSKLGKKDSEQTRLLKGESRKGKTHSESAKQKMRDKQNAIRQTEEWKTKMSMAQKGKKHTIEHTLKAIASNPKSKKCEFNGTVFLSVNQAVKFSKLTPGQLRKHPTFKLLENQ